MHDHHIHHQDTTERNLVISIILNTVIVVGELVGGILSNSLSLISDALHNFSDLISLILSFVAARIVKWRATPEKSFGYLRAEIIVAFINSTALVVIGVYIIYEAVNRFLNPEPVAGLWLIIIAGISFLANAASTILLHKNSKNDLNAKTAYLHLLFDSINSLLVVLAGILIYYFNWVILDPIFSLVIGLFIIKSGWDVLIDAVNILNESTPKEIDSQEVADFINSFPEVKDSHHLHIWSISSNFYALSAHVVVEDQLISKGYLIIDKLEKQLKDKFGINHPTIQLEADIKIKKTNFISINE